jgi:hypothetical protein
MEDNSIMFITSQKRNEAKKLNFPLTMSIKKYDNLYNLKCLLIFYEK